MGIRCLMMLLIGMCSSSLMHAPAQAQGYPSRPIRMIIPFPPGGSLDIIMRVIAPKMGEIMGQNVILDSRPGADGNIGTEIVARAPADGYSVLIHAGPLTVSPSLRSKLPFDVNKDVIPVSLLTASPHVLVAHPSVPAKSIKALYQGFVKALRSPEAEKRFAEQGSVIVASPPDEFAKFF